MGTVGCCSDMYVDATDIVSSDSDIDTDTDTNTDTDTDTYTETDTSSVTSTDTAIDSATYGSSYSDEYAELLPQTTKNIFVHKPNNQMKNSKRPKQNYTIVPQDINFDDDVKPKSPNQKSKIKIFRVSNTIRTSSVETDGKILYRNHTQNARINKNVHRKQIKTCTNKQSELTDVENVSNANNQSFIHVINPNLQFIENIDTFDKKANNSTSIPATPCNTPERRDNSPGASSSVNSLILSPLVVPIPVMNIESDNNTNSDSCDDVKFDIDTDEQIFSYINNDDIFLNFNVKCNSTSSCVYIKRIIKSLTWYSMFNQSDDGQSILNRFAENSYGKHLLKDYKHILNYHINNNINGIKEKYDDICNEISKCIGMCHVKQCKGFKRYKMKIIHPQINLNKSQSELYLQAMDFIHCYFMHLGY